MFSKIFSVILILILALQLVTLEPRLLTWAEHSVGEFSEATGGAKNYIHTVFTEATLSSVRDQLPYDSVVFVGDVMLGRHVETILNREGSEYPYAGTSLTTLSSNPAVVANFESSMAVTHTQTPTNNLRFSVDAHHVKALAENVTHVSLANNHSLDYGEEGYLNAVTLLEQESISVFGHNSRIDATSISYIHTTRGEIALIGINATGWIPEESEIESVCNKAKRRSDFQVMFVHWGDEYKPTHNDTQNILAEIMVDACADLIIGHHPHVVQDIGLIKGVPVLYSLGNYIFDQYFSPEVKMGLVAVLSLDGVPGIQLLPVSSAAKQSVPTPMEGELRHIFLKELAARSHPSLEDSIMSGYLNFIEPVATSTKMAIMSR